MATMKAKNIHCPTKTVKKIAPQTYLLSFSAPALAKRARPGQFIHLHIGKGSLLRRPFSIHKIKGKDVSVLFKVVGRGTELLAQYRRGENLDIIGPLGRGFSLDGSGSYSHVFLVAGGMGVAPLVFLSSAIARKAASRRAIQKAFLGARTKKDVLCRQEFVKNSFKVAVATEDGTLGLRGTALTALEAELEKIKKKKPRVKIYACGPAEMFRECASFLKAYPFCECEVSFEQFMGCGIGICLGCVIDTPRGYKRVCKDGPVFDIKEIFK